MYCPVCHLEVAPHDPFRKGNKHEACAMPKFGKLNAHIGKSRTALHGPYCTCDVCKKFGEVYESYHDGGCQIN